MTKLNRGDQVIGCTIIKEYTDGGMSQVYLAENNDKKNAPKEERYVIVKIIYKEQPSSNNERDIKTATDQWKKALDEFRITWSLFEKVHDNIVKPIKWTYDDNYIVIVSEFIDGPSLNKFMDDNKALTIDRSMFYFQKICYGVSHFHHINNRNVIVHRDLKPENIILTKDLSEIKIIDYGIATAFYDNQVISSEGTIYCTADYTTPDVLELKPEIINAALNGDEHAKNKMNKIISTQFDFHALGVILFYMITGDLPFKYNKNDTPDIDIIRHWKKYDIPIISNTHTNIPCSIDNIIFRCTASKPEDIKFRYKNIDELIQDVSTWSLEERRNEPLLKPMEKRVFQQPFTFDVKKEMDREKFYEQWWFYACVAGVVSLVVIVIIVILVLYYTKAGGIFA